MHEVQNYTKTEAKHILVVEAKVNHDTQFYRIKRGGGVSLFPSPITFERADDMWILF